MYIRVSSTNQCIDRQVELSKELGIEKTFIDKQSGRNAERTALKECLRFLREGDSLYVADISRLARNVKDLLNIVEELKNKGVDFISVKEGINTNTDVGAFILTIFGALYQLELSNIKERQREGIAAARKYHPEKYAGRKKIDIDKDRFISMLKDVEEGRTTARAVQKEFNISPQTYYRRKAEYNI
jgi:DNA invertase Pin-like site-specific DNA recombinase